MRTKVEMLRELLTLIDALPEAGEGNNQPPEAQLQPLTLTLTHRRRSCSR